MADIRRDDGGYGQGIMSSGGGSKSNPGTPGPGEVLQPEWTGQNSPKKTVQCRVCGRSGQVPVVRPDTWLCWKCNPDVPKQESYSDAFWNK